MKEDSSTKTIPLVTYGAKDRFMQTAIDEAREGIHSGHGGPFGSVVVKDGKVVAQGHNMVFAETDSTAHGEITAIRRAEKKLGTHKLNGCVLYTTAEPCPMCLGACKWANIEKVYYGCRRTDTADIGFRDEQFYEELGFEGDRSGYLEEKDREACLELFKEYTKLRKKRY